MKTRNDVTGRDATEVNNKMKRQKKKIENERKDLEKRKTYSYTATYTDLYIVIQLYILTCI